jgi:hypothetical protein
MKAFVGSGLLPCRRAFARRTLTQKELPGREAFNRALARHPLQLAPSRRIPCTRFPGFLIPGRSSPRGYQKARDRLVFGAARGAGSHGPEAVLARPASPWRKPAPTRALEFARARSAYPAQRNPMLLFRFVGSFLLRFETRTFCGLLFQEPPRISAAFHWSQDKTLKQLLPQPPGIAKRRVSQPRMNPEADIREAQLPRVIELTHRRQPRLARQNPPAR